MKSPWESYPLKDYEAHMQLPDIKQLQILNAIMKTQIDSYPVKVIAIWGVAGGNGLEHIDTNKITKVYGVDINQDYLNVCKERYSYLGDCLNVQKADLADLSVTLPTTDLVIANLLIEYIGIETFVKHMKQSVTNIVSCVIQKNLTDKFVSKSPFTTSLSEISKRHLDINRNELVKEMGLANMDLMFEAEYSLPNQKKFVRLDFKTTKLT